MDPPSNGLVTPLLTDLYQITMAYAHWKNGRQNDPAVFELFFRKNPFGGEFTILVGLDEVLKLLASFKYTHGTFLAPSGRGAHSLFRPVHCAEDIEFLKSVPSLEKCDLGFFDWLLHVDTSQVKVRAIQEGSVVFPRVPLLTIEAPLGVGQLLETTLLTLLNFPSLIATNAARMVMAASPPLSLKGTGRDGAETPPDHPAQCFKKPVCIEFGLRRAQGPDGGFSASKYSAIGGFVATSNVQAGKLCGLRLAGTHAHAFVQAYSSLDEVKGKTISNRKGNNEQVEILPKVLWYREKLAEMDPRFKSTNDGELAAFIAYALAFPDSFLCLIDTYDTLASGILNFVLVGYVLDDLGYQPRGIRLDSGDLAYLSMEVARYFQGVSNDRPIFAECDIVASNDINEEILHAINKQDHAITAYGIGTNLVTCQAQPALGCVYKLVEIAGVPRMKLSQEITKVLIPGKKKAYRLIGKDNRPILDLMVSESESAPEPGKQILCCHPFDGRKRVLVTPTGVERLDVTIFEKGAVVQENNRTFEQAKESVQIQLKSIRPDILRDRNPTPYKVSVSNCLYNFLHELWQKETPIMELS